MMNEEENCMSTLSRTSRSLSSPDSQSSFIDETEKSHRKQDSTSDECSDGSTASSLKRKLRNLPSSSDGSSLGDRFAYSYNRIFRKKQDLLYHLQEFSNSIEEQEENEMNSATRITSLVDSSKLQTPRVRRRAIIHEAMESQISQSIRRKIPRFMNEEESNDSQNSSISNDLSEERLKFKNNSEKSSEGGKFNIYENELKVETKKTSLSCSPVNFSINNSISSGQRTKRIGGYRPNAIPVRNLSFENESDTENERNSNSILKIQESKFSSQHCSKFTGITNQSQTAKIDGEFEEFLENLSKNSQSAYSTPQKKTNNNNNNNNRNCDEKYFAAPNFDRNDSFELTRRRVSQTKTNNFFQTEKNFEIPILKLRSRDSSLSTSGKNNELQDMKALFSEISDVGFKQKNAFGDSGKIHSTLTECRGSSFSIGRNSSIISGTQIKSHDSSHLKNVPISPTENLNSENEAKKSEEIFDLKSPNSNTMETDTEILPLKKLKIDEQEMGISLESEADTIILDDSVELSQSPFGDSNHQDQRKWTFQCKMNEKNCPDIVRHEESIEMKDNPSINIFQRSAHFNSMKLAKSKSAAILDKKSSTDKNPSANNSSSMSKLSFLLESMKKENQDRCPFTITENVKNEEIPMKEFSSESLKKSDEENFYKLNTHPSITRLALSGNEILPSELINSVSFDNTPRRQNFFIRMINFLRRISIRLTRKNSSSSAKILYQNNKCNFESFTSSGSQDNNVKRCSSDELDKQNYSMQLMNSETESCLQNGIHSVRVKSSPVDIISPSKHQNHRYINDDQSENAELENCFAEKTNRENTGTREKIEESFISDIVFENRELPCKSAAESSCFCFKMCL